MRRMSVVSHLFNNRMQQRLEAEGFTLAQFNILNHLEHQPANQSTKISDIAAAVEVLQPAVTKAVNKLGNLNLIHIQGDKHDKRIKLIAINDNGRNQLQQLQMIFAPDIMAWNEDWSDEDMQNFTTNLQQFGKWLDQNRL